MSDASTKSSKPSKRRAASLVTERQHGADTTSNRIRTAVVEDISPDGVLMVVPDGETQARAATTLLRFPTSSAATEALLGRTVLLLDAGTDLPLVLGVIHERVWDKRDSDTEAIAVAQLAAGAERVVQADKRRLTFDASEEIRLTCGHSSLVMRRDGTIVVRGVKIVSRATESNKIRGGTISLN